MTNHHTALEHGAIHHVAFVDIDEIEDYLFDIGESTIEQINEDLYFILVEKTGESATKVKSVMKGEGIHAYFKIYWWFVKTAGICNPRTFKEDNATGAHCQRRKYAGNN